MHYCSLESVWEAFVYFALTAIHRYQAGRCKNVELQGIESRKERFQRLLPSNVTYSVPTLT